MSFGTQSVPAFFGTIGEKMVAASPEGGTLYFNLSTDDLRSVASAVLRHRIILNFDAHADGQTPETLLEKIVQSVTAAAV